MVKEGASVGYAVARDPFVLVEHFLLRFVGPASLMRLAKYEVPFVRIEHRHFAFALPAPDPLHRVPHPCECPHALFA